MGRKVDVDDLVTAQQITELLGLSRPQLVYGWRSRGQHGFPDPVGKVGNLLVWEWPVVEAWAKRTGRL